MTHMTNAWFVVFPNCTALRLNNQIVSPVSGQPQSFGQPVATRRTSPQRPESPVYVNAVKQTEPSGHYARHPMRTNVKPKLYKVLYPYKPRQMDELELTPGDLLTVTMHCTDGWFVGRSTLSQRFGTFPGNYVEEL